MPMDPDRTMLVLKTADGKELARFRASSRYASQKLQDYARENDGMTVDYEPCDPMPPVLKGIF